MKEEDQDQIDNTGSYLRTYQPKANTSPSHDIPPSSSEGYGLGHTSQSQTSKEINSYQQIHHQDYQPISSLHNFSRIPLPPLDEGFKQDNDKNQISFDTALDFKKSVFDDETVLNSNTNAFERTLNNDVKLLEKIYKPVQKSSLRSNKGCLTCKSRKHKCDEHRPVCKECARINMKCVYAPKGFVNLENVEHISAEGGFSTDSNVAKKKIKANETYIEGIGSVKILRAKVDHKLVNGKVVYRA